MKQVQFPLTFNFHITTFSNDFTATDASGQTIAYVKQKMFKLKEAISIFSDTSQTNLNYKINADQWLDFSASYKFSDSAGTELGKIARKGWASLWKARYEIVDQYHQLQYHISEANPWVKMLDAIVGEIPIINFFTGLILNPTYNVTNLQNEVVVKLIKKPSFFGKTFAVEKVREIDGDDVERIVLALMMMVLLEKRRG